MATTVDFIEFVCEQVRGNWDLHYKKMFGEYMVYANGKPVLLVCNSTVYVKQVEALAELMQGAAMGIPYTGAKEHYILDIDNAELSRQVVGILEPITPLPKPRKQKTTGETK